MTAPRATKDKGRLRDFSTNGRLDNRPAPANDRAMFSFVEIDLLVIALAAAALAGHRYARRRDHPRYVHHSIAFTIVAVVAGASLLFFGPT